MERNGRRIIQSEKSDEHFMVLNKDDSAGYPFGRFTWKLSRNVSFCKVAPGGSMSLTFSSCPPETFTCNSG